MPNVAFYRSQAEAFCKLAEVIEAGATLTPDGQLLAEELRELARQYYAEAGRLEQGRTSVETAQPRRAVRDRL